MPPPVVGQPINRVDGRLKVTGGATYTADTQIPNVAHAMIVSSAIAKGTIASMDTLAAERTPGVLAVLSHKNKIKLAKDPMEVDPGSPANRALTLLQDNRVVYGNQPIAVVVAETFEIARDAAGLVKVRYAEEAPSVRLDSNLKSAYKPKKVGGAGASTDHARGSVDKGKADAQAQIREIYSTPFSVHSPLEPHCTIAVWEGPDHLTLYDTSQGIFGDRKRVAELVGLEPENVRVVSLFIGGGFGSKGPTWSHNVLCAMAARQVRRPVKLVLRRPQMFGPVGCRSETRQTITAGARNDGSLTLLQNETLTHTSTIDEFAETATFPTRMLYSTPNNSTTQRLVRSDIGTPSYTRAPGEAPGSFALEVAMDELAYKLNMDPLQLRLKNYAERDEEKDQPWSTKSLRECYRVGAERFNWSRRTSATRSMRQGHTLIGLGMATSLYPARRSPSSARARIYPNGTVLVEAGSQDLGGGTYTIMTQIAADALGVAPSMVTFRLGDTRYPETPVSGGSQTAASAGSGVFEAARALRSTLIELAMKGSSESGRSPDDLVISGDKVALKDGSHSTSLTQLMAGQPFVDAQATTKENEDAKTHSMYSFGAQFAEVHVDADLGQIHVARMVGVFGAGKILNAKTARNQFIGGMTWGISMALHEKALYDERLGRIVNNNLAEYHVPSNPDVGTIDVSWVEEDDRMVSPIGAKGIGEIGITGAAAAIATAVFHATGKRIRTLPITLDVLL